MASGRLHLFVLHFPLGVAMFGGLVPLAFKAWTAADTPAAERELGRSAVFPELTKLTAGGEA